MKEYLKHLENPKDTFPFSWMDELPLWSAPFGLKLLDTIRMKSNSNILDIGFGFGFPLLEVAMRMGAPSQVYGVDAWDLAIETTNKKILQYEVKNVAIMKGTAEKLPFEDHFFDLIISNNGINNVDDIPATFAECYRVAKPGAQFVFTMNLDRTMKEFYKIFKEVLQKNDLQESVIEMKKHIYDRRKPVKEMRDWIERAGFRIRDIIPDSFSYRFVDGTAMLNHFFIKYGFLDSWVKIVPKERLEEIFDQVENGLNSAAERKKELKITIPFATFDCKKPKRSREGLPERKSA